MFNKDTIKMLKVNFVLSTEKPILSKNICQLFDKMDNYA